MFAIPDWLEAVLDWLNLTILGLYFPIGDKIRQIIMFLLSPINSLAAWAIEVSNYLSELLQEILDALNVMGVNLNLLIAPFVNWFDNLGAMLNEWFSGISPTILGWIDTARQFVLDVVGTVSAKVTEVWTGFFDFKDGILPWLADKTFVDEAIRAAFGLWGDLFNLMEEVKDDLRSLFSDPGAWLYDQISKMIERFW